MKCKIKVSKNINCDHIASKEEGRNLESGNVREGQAEEERMGRGGKAGRIWK